MNEIEDLKTDVELIRACMFALFRILLEREGPDTITQVIDILRFSEGAVTLDPQSKRFNHKLADDLTTLLSEHE